MCRVGPPAAQERAERGHRTSLLGRPEHRASARAQRFITGYAQEQATRAGPDITFTAVLSGFAPQTGVGQAAVQAYAAREGRTVEEYLQQSAPLLTPEIAGAAVVELVQSDAARLAPATG